MLSIRALSLSLLIFAPAATRAAFPPERLQALRRLPADALSGGAAEHVRAFRQEAVDWFLERINDPEYLGASAEEAAAGLQRELAPRDTTDPIGGRVRISIVEPEGHLLLRLVRLSCSAPCGEDLVQLVLHLQEGRWAPLIMEETPQGSPHAFGTGRILVTPAEPGGGFHLAFLRLGPGCEPGFRPMGLGLYRYGPGIGPRFLREEGFQAYAGGKEAPELAAEGKGFRLRFRAPSLDPARPAWTREFHFRAKDEGIERVPPFAASPQDLLEEFLSLPWARAEAFVQPEARKDLEVWHTQFQATAWTGAFAGKPVREAPGRWRVPLDIRRPEARTPTRVFFRLEGEEGRWLLSGVEPR